MLDDFFRKGFEEELLIQEITKFYPNPFSDYLSSPIPISAFFERHKDFQELKEYIDEDNIIESLNTLEKSINPSHSFKNDVVNIMSIHKSKGLQADYVFIIGLNEGIIPNMVRGIDTIEAQRRLLFVGMTRVKEKLYMVSTVEWEGKYVNRVDKTQFKYKYWKKVYYGKTTRFVGEMR